MQPVVVVIEYKSHPHTSAQALRELSELIATVVAVEPACRGIRLLQDSEDPSRILLWEDWTDKAEYVGPHMKTPHLLSFIQRAGSIFVGPPTINFWYTRTEKWPA